MKVTFHIAKNCDSASKVMDLQQTAQNWISYMMETLGHQLMEGHDPSITMEFEGCHIEFRCNKIPGCFDRVNLEL